MRTRIASKYKTTLLGKTTFHSVSENLIFSGIYSLQIFFNSSLFLSFSIHRKLCFLVFPEYAVTQVHCSYGHSTFVLVSIGVSAGIFHVMAHKYEHYSNVRAEIYSLNEIIGLSKVHTFTTIVIQTEHFIILFINIIVGFIQF